MYFAIENKASADHSAVWAIDSDWLDSKGRELFQKESIQFPADVSPTEFAEHTNRLLRETEVPVVIRINPAMSNPRLFAQRGLFLCKLVEQASVGQLLMTMVMYPTVTDRPIIRKLEIGTSLRIEFLKRLRAMNIHRASLFPGLDGLGLSLKLDLELRDT